MAFRKKFRKLIRNPRKFLQDFCRKTVGDYGRNAFPNSYRSKERYTIVAAVYNVEEYVDDFIKSLVVQSLSFEKNLRLILVSDGSSDDSVARCRVWQRKYPKNILLLEKENGGQASARNLGLQHVETPWVTFVDPDDFLHCRYFEEVDRMVRGPGGESLAAVACNLVFWREWNKQHSDTHPLRVRFSRGNRIVPVRELREDILLSASSVVFRAGTIQRFDLTFSPLVKPNFEDAHFVVRLLMSVPEQSVGFASKAVYHYRKRRAEDSTLDRSWATREQFYDKLKHGHLSLIQEALEIFGRVPDFVQFTQLYDLSWYYRRILNDPSSVAHLSAGQKSKFHDLVREVLSHIEPAIIMDFELAGLQFFHKAGLLHASRRVAPDYQVVYVDGWDDAKRQVRLRYYTASEVSESFLVQGCDVVPTHAKYRVHDFAGKTFVFERVVWLPVGSDEGELTAVINKGPTVLSLLKKRTDSLLVSDIKDRLGDGGKRPSPSVFDFKLRRLLKLAKSESARSKYCDSWLLMDRDTQADDNAEHLYRYLMTEQPQVKAFFVLRKESHDWDRLDREGFRLLAFGSREHRVALLNARHLISSHADTYVVRLFPARWYSHIKSPKFTFLQHGITKDDMSGWFNSKEIACLVTSGVGEFESMVGDRTSYKFTGKEVALTGFPRHDALLRGRQDAEKTILIMPTWRLSLSGKVVGKGNERELNEEFPQSQFAQSWKGVLHSERLRKLASDENYRIVFFPHANIQPYLAWFEVPDWIETLGHESGSIQKLFSSATLMVTDYSSVAFELAILGRSTVYFQFDRAEIFSGGHLYGKGYFEYEEHGFGPVCLEEEEVLRAVEEIVRRGGKASPLYAGRMKSFFAHHDDRNCERTYRAIRRLDDSQDEVSTELLLSSARAATRFEQWEAAESRWSHLLTRELTVEIREEAIRQHSLGVERSEQEKRALADEQDAEFLQENGESSSA